MDPSSRWSFEALDYHEATESPSLPENSLTSPNSSTLSSSTGYEFSNEEKKELLGFEIPKNPLLKKNLFRKQLQLAQQYQADLQRQNPVEMMTQVLEQSQLETLKEIVEPRFLELMSRFDHSYLVEEGDALINYLLRRIFLEMEMFEERLRLPEPTMAQQQEYTRNIHNSLEETLALSHKLTSRLQQKKQNNKLDHSSEDLPKKVADSMMNWPGLYLAEMQEMAE